GLAACTDYEFQVQSNCDGATSAWSGSFNFTTTGCTGGCTYVTINSNNFNSTWGIWNDGGSDCRRSANDAPYANGGTGRPVRLRDNTSSSVMTTDNLDLSGYDELTIDFNYLPRLMENGEDFWLQVSSNGGASYTTVEDWIAGVDFSNNTREFESVVISGPFTSNTRLRFRCDATANSDYIYIDDVVISGCQSSGALIQPDVPVGELQVAKEEVVAPNDLQLFPNPVQDQLTVRFNIPAMEDVILQVTDLQGRTMSQEQFRAVQGRLETTVDVYSYPAGIYFMHMMTPSGKITKKFMVNK
ncbi:MAG: T9SS type A sorting domain-containing protein, partial [Saprospiraceae bacterium]|nr:T9SS type A sorting domain-containing protein [Saprospiraceae bacterium]